THALRELSADDGSGPRLDSLDLVFNGSEPIDPGALEASIGGFAQRGFRPSAMAPCYGLAEATLAVTLTPRGAGVRIETVDRDALRDGRAIEAGPNRRAVRLVSCGTPTMGNSVTIVDDTGEECPDRRVGEIVVRGASVCAGYFRDEEATRVTFRRDGLRTGDEGYLSEGHLFVVGRKKDLLILRGQNVSPVELEWAAERVPGVRPGGTVAFSVPDPDAGTERAVVLVRASGPRRDETTLRRRVSAKIVDRCGFAADVQVVSAEFVPRTSSGKIRRRAAREKFLQRLRSEATTR
ncbi:MAG: AMP-binding protein, partial [Planctomycetota bacterium]|nr:AMP-binding protein [Planctomycetota bacterium]